MHHLRLSGCPLCTVTTRKKQRAENLQCSGLNVYLQLALIKCYYAKAIVYVTEGM